MDMNACMMGKVRLSQRKMMGEEGIKEAAGKSTRMKNL